MQAASMMAKDVFYQAEVVEYLSLVHRGERRVITDHMSEPRGVVQGGTYWGQDTKKIPASMLPCVKLIGAWRSIYECTAHYRCATVG